jgi:hypothetical protein
MANQVDYTKRFRSVVAGSSGALVAYLNSPEFGDYVITHMTVIPPNVWSREQHFAFLEHKDFID